MKLLLFIQKKTDWVFLIRLIASGIFITLGAVYKDWLPPIFGCAILVTGIIAHKTKTGCGYGNCNRPGA